MKQYTITGNTLSATTIQLPASKSISNRALIIRALAGGGPMPENLSDCDDTTVLVRALSEKKDVIDIGAAGTAMRFLTAYLAVTPDNDRKVVLTGTERMHHRPIGILVDALRQLGASVEYVGEEGFPPVCVQKSSSKDGPVKVLSGGPSEQSQLSLSDSSMPPTPVTPVTPTTPALPATPISPPPVPPVNKNGPTTVSEPAKSTSG